MADQKKSSNVLTGAAGEHYVLYRLFKEGILAGQPPNGVADIDLLVLDEDANIVTNLQVKTTKGTSGWMMGEKHEKVISDRLFYIFVNLGIDPPECFVIPSEVVAKHCADSHRIWLATPGRNGRMHKDTSMRRITPNLPFEVPGFPHGWMNKYKEAWSLLSA